MAAGPPGSRRRAASPAVAHRRGARLGTSRAPPRRTARVSSHAPAPRWKHSKSPAVAHRLCAPIHPVPSLFVPLCVKNNCTSRRTPLRDFPSHPLIIRAARWGHRALPPLRPQNSHTHYARAVRTPPLPTTTGHACAPAPRRKPSKSPAVSHRLCAPIHPVPSLFVPLCVKNNRTPRSPRPAPRSCPVTLGRDAWPPPPVGTPHPPGSRRAAPPAVDHRRGARLGKEHTLRVLPGASPCAHIACRGSRPAQGAASGPTPALPALAAFPSP